MAIAAQAAPVLAQDAPAAPPAAPATEPSKERSIEEIIVTGTKREQAAQDVPIAITAISDTMIENQFRTDVLQLGNLTPGVALGQVAGFRAIAGGVRGTGQNSILVTQDSSVVLLVDEFALSNVQAQFVELFDVDRVEIYRGPQGTLFGKSATGGAISIITKRPELEGYSADLRFEYGSFDGQGVPSHSRIQKYRAAVNVPLIEDKLALRATVILDRDDGYYVNNKRTAAFPSSVPFYGFCSFISACPVGVSPGSAVNPAFSPTMNLRAVGSGDKLNNTDVLAGKIKLLFQPTDHYEAYFMYDYLNDDSGSPPGVNESEPTMLLPLLGFPSIQQAGHDNVYSTGETDQCFEGSRAFCLKDGHRVDVQGYQLHQTLTFDKLTLKAITGWREQKEILPSTYTGEAYASLFDASRNTVKKNTQIELRGTTTFDGPVNLVGGFVWSREQTDMLAYATVGLLSLITFTDQNRNDLTPAPAFDSSGFLNLDTDFQTDPAMTGARQDRKTYAFYADGTYDITERLAFTAGLRWTKDKKDFFRRANAGGLCTALTPAKDQVLVGPICKDARSNAVSRVGGGFSAKDLRSFDLPLPDDAFGIHSRFNDSWSELTYRLVMNYKVTDDSMAYFSYATGFIPGGFTETCSSLATCKPFNSEKNWNVEIGFKGQFLDNQLQTNAAVFFTQYKDLIRSQVVPFTDEFGNTTQETINVNAGVSQATGFELEGTWLVTDALSLFANFAYLHHEYKTFVLNSVDLSDNTVPFSPKLKWGLTATYEQPIPYGTLTANLIYSHQDKAAMSVFNSPFTNMSKWDTIDVNLRFEPESKRYFVTLWGKNLTDERTRIAANSVAGLWNFTMYGRPRSYGVEIGLHFGD
jgi:iron complex outermembrane receptor protein